jgi:hypothetical protein
MKLGSGDAVTPSREDVSYPACTAKATMPGAGTALESCPSAAARHFAIDSRG